MTTGLKKAGVDLDTLFKARTSTKRADVGYKSNSGVDISNRFEPIGAGTPIAATGLKSGGTDLANLFKDIAGAGGPLAVAAGADVFKAANTSTITSASTTAIGSGGTGSYTYSWTRISGSTGVTATAASSATTAFTGTGFTVPGEIRNAVFRCTVNDGSTTATDDINVQLERTGL